MSTDCWPREGLDHITGSRFARLSRPPTSSIENCGPNLPVLRPVPCFRQQHFWSHVMPITVGIFVTSLISALHLPRLKRARQPQPHSTSAPIFLTHIMPSNPPANKRSATFEETDALRRMWLWSTPNSCPSTSTLQYKFHFISVFTMIFVFLYQQTQISCISILKNHHNFSSMKT